MTPFTYPHALHRLTNRPLLVTPAKAAVLFDVLRDRASWDGAISFGDPAAANGVREAAGQFDQLASKSDRARREEDKAFSEIDGLAIIPVHGTLVQRGGLDPWSGMTGYDGIATKLDAAAADPSIAGIVLDIDSYGGEVSGCFDACDVVMAARAEKPVWAICAEYAYSAAYALASQADRIILPRTGGVGSIGVVALHVDFSKALAKDGVAVTLIHAGAHKVDGNPYEPLPDEVRDDFQNEVEATRLLFAETVARGRDLDTAAVLGTEAQSYGAATAVALGLADAVMSPDDGLEAFRLALADKPLSVPG